MRDDVYKYSSQNTYRHAHHDCEKQHQADVVEPFAREICVLAFEPKHLLDEREIPANVIEIGVEQDINNRDVQISHPEDYFRLEHLRGTARAQTFCGDEEGHNPFEEDVHERNAKRHPQPVVILSWTEVHVFRARVANGFVVCPNNLRS